MHPFTHQIKNVPIGTKLKSAVSITLLFCVFFMCACKKQPNPQNTQVLSIQESELLGEWTHSHEEDSMGFFAYRKKPYDFPPSRGRKSFILNTNHHLVYFDLSPACGLSGFKGTWSYHAGQLTLAFNDQILCYQIRYDTSRTTKIYLSKCP